MNTANTTQQAFNNLISKFGRRPGSHLFPLFNYFFVPQTKSQLLRWKKSINNGIHNQDLLLDINDFDLIKAFSPETTMKLTKSKSMCRISLNTFVRDVANFINNK